MLFVMLAAWMVACSAAQASPVWIAQKEVGADVVGTPGVALAPGGDLVVAWATPALAGNVIAVASRPVGGAFTSAKTLSQDPSDTGSVRVAASRSGYAVVAWRQKVSGANWRAAAAVRTPAGAWGPAIPLSVDGADASDVSVGISDAGEALASWVRAGRVQVSRRPPGASWTPAEDISSFGVTASAPRFDMTRQGHAVVFWIQPTGVAGAHRAPGETWKPEPVVPPSPAMELAAAVGGDGTVGLLWLTAETPFTFTAVTHPPNAGWRTPKPLGGPNNQFDGGAITVDGRGVATAVWPGTTVGGVSTTRSAGSGWSTEPALVRVGLSDASTPAVASSPAGDVVATWPGQIVPEPDGYIQAATHTPDVSWSVVQGLGGNATTVPSPVVDVDDQGNAVVAWRGDAARVIVRPYDPAGPDLLNVSVPRDAVVGNPVVVSVTPRDRWSPISATRWSFGDRGVASGSRAQYSYAAAGKYPVTVTSTDALGNATSAQRSILVKAKPGGTRKPGPKRFVVIPYAKEFRIPASVDHSKACRGKVKLSLKRKKHVLQRRRPKLNRRCEIKTKFRVRRASVRGAKRLTVAWRFGGNRVLGKSHGKDRVRVPRSNRRSSG